MIISTYFFEIEKSSIYDYILDDEFLSNRRDRLAENMGTFN